MEQKKINVIFLLLLVLGLSGFFVYMFVVDSINLTQLLISLGLIFLVFVFRMYRILKTQPSDLLAKKDLVDISKQVLETIQANTEITAVQACQTRVKLKVTDSTKIEAEDLRKLGISGIIKPSNTEIQLITKEHTQKIYESIRTVVGQHNDSL